MRTLSFMIGFTITFFAVVASANVLFNPIREARLAKTENKITVKPEKDNMNDSLNPNQSSSLQRKPKVNNFYDLGSAQPIARYNCPDTNKPNIRYIQPNTQYIQPQTRYVAPNTNTTCYPSVTSNCYPKYNYCNTYRTVRSNYCNNYGYRYYNRCGWNFPILRGLRNFFWR